jgi:hypothetical protein
MACRSCCPTRRARWKNRDRPARTGGRRKTHNRRTQQQRAGAEAGEEPASASYSDAEIALLVDCFTRSRDIIRTEIGTLNAKRPRKRATPEG